MNKCSLCSKEINAKTVICKQCEKNLKKTHPDSQKDNTINPVKVFIIVGVLIVAISTLIMLKTFAGSFASIFQLVSILIIMIVIMYQVIIKI